MKKILRFIKWVIILFFASSIGAVIAYRWLPVPCSPLMFIRLAQQVKEGQQLKMVHRWVPLDSISPALPQAVWACEDQNFLKHNGFDFEQIKAAYEEAQKGGRERGASTISQQTAKNVFLWPAHSWFRKGLETYFTILIEVFWSKQRIMEVYLNSIEMGEGIYGADAVAMEHFHTDALNLSRSQCALIAATLPNPRKFSSKNPSAYMRKRQATIEREMKFVAAFPREGHDLKKK